MYYFAYGSNLNLDHMRRICGWHCRLLCRAKLPDFEFGLDSRGFANIRPKKGEVVHGMLYEVDEDGFSMLDEFEGYPKVYGRQEVVVLDENNVKYKTQVYIEPPHEFGGTEPKEEFLMRVIASAYENKLPEEWIKKLEKFAKKESKK